ncbi:MAG: hypothetical protein ACRCS9_16010 [Hyphomicrobium sp.]
MKTFLVIAATAAGMMAASAGAMAGHEAGHGKCVMAGGEATMVTEDLAKFMAEAALKNSMKAHGWTPSGSVQMKCDSPNGLPHCMARQKACG